MKRHLFLFLSIMFVFFTLSGCKDLSHNNFTYTIKKDNSISIVGIKRLDTYSEYLTFINDNNLTKDYNKDFFSTSGLILYGSMDNSGSIQVNVTSLSIDKNNHITINITKEYPVLLNMDFKSTSLNQNMNMAYNGFIVEYKKLTKPISDISVTCTTLQQALKEVKLKDEASKNEIKDFISGLKDNLKKVDTSIWFTDPTDINQLSGDEIRTHFHTLNNGYVTVYNIDQLTGSIYVSRYTPMVAVSYTDFNETELDKLYTISLQNHVEHVYVNIIYVTKSKI